MSIKRVFRWSSREKVLRLFRVLWMRHGGPSKNPGKGYSAKLSVALTPKIARFNRECDGWNLTLFGVRVHYRRAYGGIIV